MNTMPTSNRSITLEEISKRKAEVKKEIDKQKSIIIECTRDIFTPEPADSGIGSIMQSFNKGLAIYDGVMMGIKMMRRVRKFFDRKK